MRSWRRREFMGAAGITGIALPARAAPMPRVMVDQVIVLKRKRELYLMNNEKELFRFRVALGRNPRGHKQAQGDGRTPEGSYLLDGFNAGSYYHRAILISYPSAADRAAAAARGVNPGGQIMIHGLDPAIRSWGKDHWMFNWTNGCIALTDSEMDIVWSRVTPGTPIEIRP